MNSITDTTGHLTSTNLNETPQVTVLQSESNVIRTESSIPFKYRLVRKEDGELVLQGEFKFEVFENNFSYSKVGSTWRDIPTIDFKDIKD
jgi:hypothetical protein